jgi:adenosylhomocysteine nucleosidase
VDDIAITDPCIVFALARESRPFLREFRPHSTVHDSPCWARFCGPSWLSVLVLRTGIGAEPAERAISWLMQPAVFDNVPVRPKLVLSAGFSGALTDEHHVGDVVLATEVVDEAGGRWTTCWPGELPPGPWQPPLHRGRILCVNKPIAKPDDKRRLGSMHEAVAVDMESATVAHWCSRCDIPFGAVRVISDDVSTELSPRLLKLLGSERISIPRFLSGTVRSPSLLPELWRLARQTRKAAIQLGKALGELLTLTTPLGVE